MAHELKESLLYDFDHNLFVVKTMLPNVRNVQDRESVVRWLRLLKRSAKNIEELKLRNDFMYHLVLGVQNDSLIPPFDKPPENIPLMSMVALLPKTDGTTEDQDFWPMSSDEVLATGEGERGLTRKPEMLRRSPDGGEFLAGQPTPNVGAFCYLAVVTKKRHQ